MAVQPGRRRLRGLLTGPGQQRADGPAASQRPVHPAAQWLTESRTPLEQLLTFGPGGFEASARLRFIPDPAAPGQAEADVELGADHPSDLDQARQALHVLAAFTDTPDRCWFCLWVGYPYDAWASPGAQTYEVVLPHRTYVMFAAPLELVDELEGALGGGRSVAPPAFVWPDDRRWCVASDVDPHWAGIGAEQRAIDALVAERGLDVVQVRPEEPQPRYR